MKHWVEIVEYGTERVEHRIGCNSERGAERVENGVNLNLDHSRFYTRIVTDVTEPGKARI